MDKRTWTTYKVRGYTHQVGDNPAATGGLHQYQVRRHRGFWQKRILESNGNHASPGPVKPIDDAEGEALWAMAKEY